MLPFAQRHVFLLAFGIIQIFFSAPGQTFLIALVVMPLFGEIGVSQTMFAAVYSAATLLAALLLNPAGHLIDKYNIRTIVVVVTVAMSIGCYTLAHASNITMVFCGFFILRLIGQGIFSLSASVLMIKNFEKNRGKSMGIITLGFPISEAIYPILSLFLISFLGWRVTYMIFGLSNVLIMLPLQLWLLSKSNIIHGKFQEGETIVNPQRLYGNPEKHHWPTGPDTTLKQAMRDVRFYLIILATCLPPMVVTGLFFHQESLYRANEWSLGLIATGFILYAVTKAIGSVWVGILVDKYGPLRPFVALILFLGLGVFLAATGGPNWVVYLYYAIIGSALGFSSPVSSVVWPYFYGTKYMGSIKGMVATFRNGVTALGPLPIAMCLDAGITINQVLFWKGVLCIILSGLPFIIFAPQSGSLNDGTSSSKK